MDRDSTFNAHRPLLFAIAYRMLGSAADAEDVVQDAFVRWRGAREDEIASAKAYLSTIVTRLCIDFKKSARAQREQYIGPWLPEPIQIDPRADASDAAAVSESLSTAFLLVLEKLSPVERAVFLLRFVFDFEYEDIGPIVGKTAVNCRQIAARARERIHQDRRRFSVPPEEQQRIASQFAHALSSGNLEGLLAVLSEDAVLYADTGGKITAVGKVRALARPLVGSERVAHFILAVTSQAIEGMVRKPMQLNGLPGMVSFLDGKPFSALTLDIVDGRVRAIYVVANPDKLTRIR